MKVGGDIAAVMFDIVGIIRIQWGIFPIHVECNIGPLLRVITVSLETNKIVAGLPELDIE